MHACIPSAWETEIGGWHIQGQPELREILLEHLKTDLFICVYHYVCVSVCYQCVCISVVI